MGAVKLFAQTDSLLDVSDQETILESQASDDDFKFDLENPNLKEFRLKPLNINQATAEQLRLLGFLTEIQIHAIIQHRINYGKFQVLYELQTITALDFRTIKLLLPFISLKGAIGDVHIPFKRLIAEGQHSFITRLQQNIEKASGYNLPNNPSASNHYLGGAQKIYFRYKYQYGSRLSFGILGDKDAGEQFFKGTQKQGFDFYAAHLFFKTNTWIKAVALGDYELRFGQGLGLFTGFAATKSPLIWMVKKSGVALKAFTSANESYYLRGAACELGFGRFSLVPFVSYKRIDANLATHQDTLVIRDDGLAIATSIATGGYHRTLSEWDNKGKSQLLQTGMHVNYTKQALQLGSSVIFNKYDVSIEPSKDLYAIYAFNGSQLLQGTLDYSYVFRNVNFFGETAYSLPGSYATMNGLMANIDPKVDAVMIYRQYSPAYHTIYAKAFAEGSTPDNESGFFTGLQLKPIPRWTLTAYADFFSFPWLKYRVDAPSKGNDYLLQATFKPAKTTELYIRASWKSIMQSPSSTAVFSGIGALRPVNTHRYRFNLIHAINKSWVLKARAEFSAYQKGNAVIEKGLLVFTEMAYAALSKPMQFAFRYEIFNIESYNARIYTYEADVLGSFSIPALYGKGARYYGMLQYNLGRHVSGWIRLSQTIYPGQLSTGSGLEFINTNHKSDVKVQLRYQF